MAGINREYKDRLFKFIFGNDQNKAWTLSLYNAVNGTSYTDENEIEITTLGDAVYMGMKNDVSFLISDVMNLYEQQSTYNPNMPLRYLIYAGHIYDSYVKMKQCNPYSPYLQKIPGARCICFYNGRQDEDERSALELRDAFETESDIQVHVSVININWGKNRSLLESCKPLGEYSWFVEETRKNQSANLELKDAIGKAIDDMPDDYLIKPLLVANRAEVEDMCITEYDEAEYNELLRAECEARGEARGREEGEVKGTLKTLVEFIKEGLITEEKAAKKANMTVAEFRKAEAQYLS